MAWELLSSRQCASANQICRHSFHTGMYPDELFRKLRPVLGHKLKALEAVYLAGDEPTQRHVERMLRVLSANTTGIQSPPPHLNAGTFPLGTVVSAGQSLFPFFLTPLDWFHVGIFGQTGRGKTQTMLHLLNMLRKHGVPWLVFDWKRSGYRDLLSVHDDVFVFTVGRDVAPFRINPLTPPPSIPLGIWHKVFRDCLAHAWFLGEGVHYILQRVLGPDTQNLTDVLHKLQSYPTKGRALQWLQSAERAIHALCDGTDCCPFTASTGIQITDWLERNVILELDALTEPEAKFLINILLSSIYLYRKERGHADLKHVTVIEEAHHVLKREDPAREALSVMDGILRQIREYGESLVVIDQMPSTLMDSAFANTATQVCFSLKHARDVQVVGDSLLLEPGERIHLGRLPIGTALVKLQNRWHAPFFVRIPYTGIEAGNVPDSLIRERMRGCFPVRKVISPEITQPRSVQVLSPVDKQGKELMNHIQKHPLLTIAERYRQLGLNPKVGNRCKQSLLSHGYIQEVSISTRNARIKLLELTDRGRGELSSVGHHPNSYPRRGGLEHQYWCHQIQRKLKSKGYQTQVESPIGQGHTVDLLIAEGGQRFAVEVETGQSEPLRNIQKCLTARFAGVICVPTKRELAKRLQTQIRSLPKSEYRKVRLIGVWQMT